MIFCDLKNLINKNPNHSVTYTLSRNQTVVVQYIKDEKTDMFQIGRSSESAIDFIVLDTVVPSSQSSSSNVAVPSTAANKSNSQQAAPNPANNSNQQSTISRFSCRIAVDREYPYTARIFAAGFDSSKRIFLGVTLLSLSILSIINSKFSALLVSYPILNKLIDL